MLRCSACSAPARRAQRAGARCARRRGDGTPCPGTIVEPIALVCTGCGAPGEILTVPADPSTVVRCRACGGRMATPI